MAQDAQLVQQQCDYAVVNLADDSTTVYSGPCIYYGFIVTTVLSAHAIDILDGANVIDGAVASTADATRALLPIGIRCRTSLIVDPDNSSTGVITVLYRPINPTIP